MDWKVRALTLVLWLGLVLASIQNGNAEKRVVCYYTNWSVYRPGTAKFSPQNINPYLCTHLIYAFGGFTKDNTLKPFDKYQDIEKGGYAKFTGLKTYNKNLKTLLAIGGWNEGSSRFSPMVADAHRRKEFVKNCVKFLRQNHFDGLDLDWEYPAFRDGGKPRDKENYANLVEELREQFERESLKTGRSRLLLTMAVPAGIEYIDKGYDIPRLNENLDFINLLSYDYHSAFEPAVNHHSPLYPLEEDNEYNYDTELTIEYTINHLIKVGASSDKIVLGIPTYGRSYTLFNEDSTDIGSPADGPGIEGDATREKGYLAYYEICENVEKGDWEVIQPNPEAMGPYAFKENQWVGYDDENIVRAKARYVNEKNLGGIMFWSIDNDDFRGKCHDRPYPLIEAAKEALLSGNSKHQEVKEKPSLRKPLRTQSSQSNSSGRQYATSNRRSSTTEAPTRKRLGSPKSKNRSNSRVTDEENEEESNLQEDEEEDNRNTVRVSEKPARSRLSNKIRPRSRSTESNTPRKLKNREYKPAEDSNGEESLSNRLTTPEPPTTPDPGSDFKCEDEGFFSHPRDCKKYFWCLDSGPSGLGIVGHQFTCPSGLVFNKGADSCDYPRNVVCPKVKSGGDATTTKAPTTTAISRTTTRRTTTEKPESEEEYEYEDEEEEEEAPKTTAKPLLYKTISRNRPSSTTRTPPFTTTTTVRTYEKASEKSLDVEEDEEEEEEEEEEEDPRVIKELIDLIKKAGGIEHLEKQLLLQEKHAGGQVGTTVGSGQVTPATISRSLYERVLNRQASKVGSRFFGTSSSKPLRNEGDEAKEGNKSPGTGFTNGPGRAQFDGLDDLPEVKSLRRTSKPQYTTIERSRSSPSERIDENEDEKESDDNADVASSEERSISNPPDDKSLLPRVTPSYVNIRRHRPTTTSRDDNDDVNVKEEKVEEERSTRRRFPFTSTRTEKSIFDKEDEKPQRYLPSNSKNSTNEVQSPTESEPSSKRTIFQNRNVDASSTSKSRYISIQRFRSTTEKSESNQDEVQEATTTPEVTTQTTQNISFKDTTTVTSAPGSSEIPYTVSMTYSQSSSSSSSLSTSPLTTTSPSTENPTTQYTTLKEEPTPSTKTTNPTRSSFSSVKLVENSATEILLTSSPFTSPSTTSTESTTKENLAAVSQPRPFGFTRGRTRPSLTQTSSFLDSTTPLSSIATVPSRSKVSTTSRNFARSTNTYQTRSRAKSRATTESSSRIFSERFNEDIEDQKTSTQASKTRGRSRGSSRYAQPTAPVATEEISPNSVTRTRNKVTTISSNDGVVQTSRRGRRPTAKSNIGRGSRNELDDSPIIRISQDVPERSQPVGRSRRPAKSFDEAAAQITKIRVFKESESATTRSRTRQRSRFEDSTAQASIRDLSETTSTSRLEDETLFVPSSSYNLAKKTRSYLKPTEGKEERTSWTGLNSIYPHFSTDLGVNTATFPSITTEPVNSRNHRRKFNATYNELSGSSTIEPPSQRKRILLVRRRQGTDTSTTATEDGTRNQRRKIIRRLRPVEEKPTSTEGFRDQEQRALRSRFFTRPPTPKATTGIIQIVVTTDNPSTLNKNYFYGSFTTQPDPTNPDVTTFSNEFNPDSTEAFQTTFLDQATEAGFTYPLPEDDLKFDTKPTTDYDTLQTSTLPTTVVTIHDDLTTLVELINNRTSIFRTSPISSALETTTPISPKISEFQNTRPKISRRLPQPTRITNGRRFPVLSTSNLNTTTEIQPDALAKRRKSLFIRRRPSTRTQFESEKNSFDERENVDNDPESVVSSNSNEETLNNSSSVFAPDEFWKSFTTKSLNTNNNEKVEPVYRRPEYQPIFRTIASTPDSSPQESGDELETNIPSNSPRSTLSVYRKPRVRFQSKEPIVEYNDGSTQTKNRFFPKRTSTTEQSVTETLIPAKKFDYAADAYLRKQQSQRPRSKNEEIELQNLVDIYSTTPSSKPQITRLVTSVVESATTERQRILIRKKYSQLTSTTFIPVQTTTSRYERPTPTSFSLKLEKKSKENLDSKDDESLSEVQSVVSTESSIEKSTLPIENAFLKSGGKFTTESTGESSTIEIESVFNNLISSSRDIHK